MGKYGKDFGISREADRMRMVPFSETPIVPRVGASVAGSDSFLTYKLHQADRVCRRLSRQASPSIVGLNAGSTQPNVTDKDDARLANL